MADRHTQQSPKSSAREYLAMLHRLRSMTGFIQVWIDEAIARAQAGDDAGAVEAVKGLEGFVAEMLEVYRQR